MKNKGSVASLIAVLLIGFLALVLLTGIGLMGRTKTGTKKVVALSVATDTAWAEVENALKPRFDLIPSLVEAARGYAANDQDLFTHIIDARTRYLSADTSDGKVEAASQVEGFLAQLLTLRNKYPQLKTNETFRALSVAVEGTNTGVSTAQTRYNDAVREMNEYTETPFGSRLAKKAGIQPRPYFQAAAPAPTQNQALKTQD
jgi:LemA protein